MNFSRLKQIITIFAVIFLLTSCSRQLSLSYEPSLEVYASQPVSLYVIPPDQDANLTGDPPAKGITIGIIEKNEVSHWAWEALKGELKRVGYSLKTDGNEAKYQISLGMVDITDKKMSLEISVKEKEELIFIKSYTSTKKTLTLPLYKVFFGLQRPVNDLFNSSLSEIYEQFIIDLNQVVQ
ncbi:MAG: hypothetical protein H7A41_06600 [Chlamydiales bacterium]|nr:hypothetical protein [Chlamydiales bacterium]